jgi:hypothetical protein
MDTVKTTGAAPASAGTAPARRRIPARTRLDFWFDGALLAAYTLAYSLGFTGLAVHEWLGLGIGLALLLHLTLHWDWVVRTTRRLLSRGGRDRGIWLVNLALLLAMTLCVLSGVLISRVALYGPAAHRRPPTQIQLARRHADNGPGLSLSDSGNLISTALIESAIAAAVIAPSALRRHRRRMTRRTS